MSRHVPRFLAALGALAYVYSSTFIDLEKQITVYIGYALIPWVLFCASELVNNPSRVLALWASCALLVVLGWSAYPGVWIVCAVPIAAYMAVIATRAPRIPWRRTDVTVAIACFLLATVGLAPLVARLMTSGLFSGGVRAIMTWSPDEGALSDAAVVPCVVGSWHTALGLAPHPCLGEYSALGLAAIVLVVIGRVNLGQRLSVQLIAAVTCLTIMYAIATENTVGVLIRANIPIYSQIRWYSFHINFIVLMIVYVYALVFASIATHVRNTRWFGAMQAWVDDRHPRLMTPRWARIATTSVQVGIMVAMSIRSAPITGYAWREVDTWDWSRRADRVMETYRAEYEREPLQRLGIDIDRNILNLLADVPHIAYYRGLLPELETVDRYLGSPTLFGSFIVLPLEWHVASETEITVSREAMRGEKATRRDPVGWGERRCLGNGDPSQDVQRLTTYRSTIIEGRLETPCSGLAVWMDTYDEGWRIWVNGRRETLYRVNRAVRGFMISPGDNSFVLEYRATVAAWRRMKLLVGAFFPGTFGVGMA
jgi:hypothetical protein